MNKRKQSMMQVPYDYFPATTAHVREVTGYTNERVTRAYLQELCQEGYLDRLRMKMVSSLGATASIYYGTRKGAEYLAAEVHPRYLHACTQTPNWQHAPHWLALSGLKITFDKSVALQTYATISPWFQEWDTVNPEAPAEKHCRMYTAFPGGKIICNPDTGFVIRVGSHAKGLLVEFDRHTTGLSAICAAKVPGYMQLAKTKGHLRFFPGVADSFWVLSISLTQGRRDLLRKTMKTWLEAQAEKCRKEKNEARALDFLAAMKTWRFAARPAITTETALYGSIWYPCEGDPMPLVKTPVKPAGEEKGPHSHPQEGPHGHPPRTVGAK